MDALSRVELYMARFSCSMGAPVKLVTSSFATGGGMAVGAPDERKHGWSPSSPTSAASSRSNSLLSLSADARDQVWC